MTPSVEAPLTRFRWVICSLLFLATSINYMDRQILSLLKPLLDQQMGWSNTAFGTINAFFQAAYAGGLLAFGWFVDRFGVKLGYGLSVFLWSLAAGSHALVGGVGGFIGARSFLGFSEAGNFPAAIKTVAQWFPKAERALATALFNSGANAGALIAPAIVPWLADAYGWRAPFVVAGAAGLLWVFLWSRFYASPESHPSVSAAELALIAGSQVESATEDASPQPLSWAALLHHRETWAYIVAKLLTDPVWYFFLIWLPDYFKKTRGLDLKQSWPDLIGIYGLITVLSLGGGWLTGRLLRAGWSVTAARKTGLAAFAVLVLPVFFASDAPVWAAVLLIGLAGAAHQAWSATLYTVVSDIFPKRAIGSVVGIGSMAGSVGGIGFALLCGTLLDEYGAAGAHHSYALLFGYCSLAYLFAFGFHHLLNPRFQPLRLTPSL
jgi:ACS family hexuronate transporter-like MFS transporter